MADFSKLAAYVFQTRDDLIWLFDIVPVIVGW